MGFETFNPILNLGGVFLALVVYTVEIAALIVLKPVIYCLLKIKSKFDRKSNACVPRCLGKIIQIYRYFENLAFFTTGIVIVTEAVLQFVLSGMLYHYRPDSVKYDEYTARFTDVTEYFCLLGVILLLVLAGWVWWLNEPKLKESHIT